MFGGASIHDYFNDLIAEKKIVPIDEIYRLCALTHVKQSCAERKLRPDLSPNIEAVKNEKGFIYAYRVKNKQGNLL